MIAPFFSKLTGGCHEQTLIYSNSELELVRWYCRSSSRRDKQWPPSASRNSARRCGMEEAAHSRTVLRAAKGRHRAVQNPARLIMKSAPGCSSASPATCLCSRHISNTTAAPAGEFLRLLPGHVETKTDFKLLMPRTEYHCARCGGHQGHVFNDGPKRPACVTATTAWL